MKKILLSLITSAALAAPLQASTSTPPAGKNSPEPMLLGQLAKAGTPADSVRILYNLFDSSPRAKKVTYGRMLLTSAGHAHDYAAQNDILRHLAVLLASDDKEMASLLARAQAMPNSVDSRVTTLFINHQNLSTKVQTWSEEERRQRLINLLAKGWEKHNETILDKIGRLYSIAVIAGEATQGQLYLEALERLRQLSDSLPPEGYPLKNQFYTALANIYTNTDRNAQAVAADRELLRIIDGLEKQYKAAGRRYRSYAPSRYLCYRRMLTNYRALSLAEVEDLYSRILTLAALDPDVAKAEQNSRTRAYYSMATGRYAEAIPLLQEVLNQPNLRLNQRRQALRELRKAAEKTGDDAVLLRALKEYTAIIDKYDSLRTADHLVELNVRYKVAELQTDNLRLQAQSGQAQLDYERRLRVYFIVAICLLGALLVLLFLRTRRRK